MARAYLGKRWYGDGQIRVVATLDTALYRPCEDATLLGRLGGMMPCSVEIPSCVKSVVAVNLWAAANEYMLETGLRWLGVGGGNVATQTRSGEWQARAELRVCWSQYGTQWWCGGGKGEKHCRVLYW